MGNDALTLAVVGYGYWGPNIVRNAIERPEIELWGVCDPCDEQAQRCRARYPGVRTCASFDEVLADPDVAAVSIATPPATHYGLAAKALAAGKHVLVEKPLATSAADAEALEEQSRRSGLVLMPGHTFLYSPAVNKIRDLIIGGDLGEIYFITSSRMNLGLYQADGVVCDLAPHDLSILLYWLDRHVAVVSASGATVFQDGVPETAFLTLAFEHGPTANVQLSWLAPHKIRQTIVVGSKRMVVYDDAAVDGAVRVYDRGVDFTEPTNFGEHQLTYRSGDMIAPRLDPAEPLGLELADFAHAVRHGCEPRSNVALGVEIVRILDAAHVSLHAGGEPVAVTETAAHRWLDRESVTTVPRLVGIVGGASQPRDFTRVQSEPSAGNGQAHLPRPRRPERR